jgi:predicted phosphodiesterase
MLDQVLQVPNAKVIYIHGNHDHQLSHPLAQDQLRRSLERHKVTNTERIEFARFYMDSSVGLYAEHGDQFDGHDSRSPLNPAGGVLLDEAAGFYFLRYVWNRLEAGGHASLKNLNFLKVVKLVVQTFLLGTGPVRPLLRYTSDYFRAAHEGKVATLVDGDVLKFLFDKWVAKNRARLGVQLLRARDLDEDDLVALRKEHGERLGMTGAAPTETVEEAGEFEAPSWMPGLPVMPEPAKTDDFVAGLKGRFGQASGGFPKLDQSDISSVIVGHTHSKRQLRILRKPDVVYYNSGSWTENKDLLYVWAYSDGTERASGLRQLL